MLLVWLLKAAALYGISFLGWILIYCALFQSIVPPQQLNLPIHLIPNGRGQLTATIPIQNSREMEMERNESNSSQSASVISQFLSKQSKKLRFTSSSTGPSGQARFWRSGLKYDISLTLHYADRPEVADLGGILFRVHSTDEPSLITASTWQALRYEVPLHRFCRQLLELPWALWSGEGSVQGERIFLTSDLEVSGQQIGPDRLTFEVHSMSIPLQGCRVQINGHLRGLAYWLYYWRLAGVVVIVGGGTAGTWLLITLGLIIDLIWKLKSRRVIEEESEDEDEDDGGSVMELKEFEGLTDEVSELGADIDDIGEVQPVIQQSVIQQSVVHSSLHVNSSEDSTLVLVDKEEFIEGLRRRRLADNEAILEEESEEEEDQSVPNTP